MLISNRIFSLLLSVLVVQQIVAQSLNISTTGQTGTSGTNWSISSNVLTVSGTATIAASVIENHLSFNSLSIQGNSTSFAVNVSQSITSSATGNGLTIGAASNTGNISMNNAVSLAGPMTIFGGRVSIMEAFAIAGSNNLSITSINTVIIGTATIGGSAAISASGNFILGTNITAGTGFPLTAPGGFTKTGAGTSYLFSNINTTNTAVSLAGPVTVGNFNTSNAITQINTNGGNISIPGAVSAYSGTGREYMALVYANLYDATGGAVTGSTTDIYLRFNAGNQSFIGLPGMPVSFNLQYLLVAGGGGGGGSNVGVHTGGGGGGGGVAEGNLTFNTGNTLNIVIGSGGVGGGGNCCINGINGGDTGFNELGLWTGGGGGAGNSGQSAGNTGTGNNNLAVAGRSYLAGGGGGGSGRNNFVYPSGGTGTSYTQAGSGTQTSFNDWGAWGGGGGGAVSGGYFFGDLGYGGAGRSSSITGTSVVYGSGSGPRDRTSTIGSGGRSNTTDAASVNGSNGAVILRFALSSALDAASLSTAFHLNATAGSVTLGSTVANLSNIEITAGIASSITGPITGTGSLLKTGSGALTLSGDNRYTGGTTVTTGTLLLNDTAPMDGLGVIVGTLNINQNGTVQLTGLASALGYNADRVTTININGGVLETSSGQQHIWNLTGGLNFNGGGTLRSNGGTSAAAATSYFEWGVTNITVTNPTSSAEIAGRIHLRNDLGTSTFTVAEGAADNDLWISAAITQSNVSNLTKAGAGKLTFTGINSYSGATTISAGTLQIGDGGTLGTISAGAVTNNAALIFNRSDNFTISNVISGTGTVTKTGAGTLTLSGANTYTGLSTISQGTLKCGSATALGTVAGSSTILAGAALDLNGLNYSTAEPLTINGTGASVSGVIYNSTATAATFSGPITLASNTTINGTAGDLTLSGAINGAFALEIISTNKAFSQTGIVGGTTPPVSYTINTGTGLITKNAAATVAGPIAFDGGELSLSSSTSSTLANAAIIARSKTYIKNASATSFTTQGGDVLLAANIDDATDSESTNNGYIQFLLGGLTVTTNGGNITLGGSDALASGYAMGNNVSGSYEGIRVDGTLNLNSGGGNIVMRGKSYAVNSTSARWALGFWVLTTGSINSGTGTILLDGFSQSSGSAYSSALYNNGAITITSANTTADAIRMIGKSTGTSGDSWGIEANSALSVLATGDGGGITISTSQQSSTTYDAVFRGVTNILAKSGPIQLLGKQDGGIANGKWHTGADFYLGSNASTVVPTSSSNVTIQYDRFEFSGTRNIATTGSVTFQPASTSFGEVALTSWFNWNQNNQTMSGLTIGKIGNTANVTHQTNIITAAGPITLFGGEVSANANITTSNASSISLLARSGLRFSASGITLQTGGGAVVLSGDYDANSSGNIIAAGALTITTNGGAISMGGGATGSDYAYGIGTSSTIANDQTAGIWVRGAVNLNSGNGDISIRGYAANASPTVQHVPSWGVGLGLGAAVNTNPASVTINSGIGNILIEGFARNPSGLNTNSFGVVFNNWETTTTESLTITSANTTANAITLIGNTENTFTGQRTKNSLRFWSVNNNIRATGTGGGITLTGKTFDGNDHPQICWSGGNLLATSGPIIINTENEALEIGNDMYVGSRSGIAGNTTSSANIRFSIDDFSVASGVIRVASSGSLTIEPFGSSFTDYTPTTNAILGFTTASRWTLNENAQTLTGLTIGKPLNVSNITIGSTTTIAGPVTIYGGTLAINENINTTSGSTNGDILLKATTDISFAKAKSISSTGGDMIFWSDADGNGAGDIFFQADANTSYTNPVSVSTGGGHLWLGGGSGTTTWNGLTVGNSYAVGNGSRSVGSGFTHFNGITIQGTSITTSGGHIGLKGRGKTGDFSSSYSGGIYIAGAGSMNSGGGNIDIEAVAQSGTGQKYGFYNLGLDYTFSLGSGDFTIFGDASASAGGTANTTGNGVLLWSGAISSTGNITISGKKSSIPGTFGVYSNVNIATTGTNKNITIETDNLNISGGSIASSGQLILKPLTPSTSIGVGGASETLQLPASYFSDNFADGFSNIQIGSNTQTGAISSNAFTLRDNVTLLTSGSLTLGGKPILGSNNVTLGSAISSISGTPTHYFQTNDIGKVFRNVSNSSTFQFPLGNSSYNPVSITNNSGSADNFSVRVIDAVYLNGTSGSVVSTPVVNRTWDISKTNANASAGVGLVFNWNTGEVANGSLSAPKMNHHTGSVWEIPTVTSTTFATNTLTVVGYTGTFSPFTVAEGTSALPVEMVYFYANCAEGDVELNWQTASEHNSDYFQLETSLDAVNWEIVQTIPAAGFSQELLNYSAVDQDAARNKKYYRLKQVDFNGEFEMYGPLKADCAVESSDISLYPNPCETQVTVSVATQISTELNYTLISPEGKVLENKQMAVQSGMTAFTLDVSGYPSGMYILQFDLNDKRFIKKLTVQ